jgi:hypothetical protein
MLLLSCSRAVVVMGRGLLAAAAMIRQASSSSTREALEEELVRIMVSGSEWTAKRYWRLEHQSRQQQQLAI